MDIRLIFNNIVEVVKGKWGIQGNVEQKRDTLPRVRQACGECKTIV